MRIALVMLFAVLVPGGNAYSQEFTISARERKTTTSESHVYRVYFTEFRMADSSDVKIAECDFAKTFEQLKNDKEINIIETGELRIYEGHDAVMQVGRTETITIESSDKSLHRVERPMGTLVSAKASTVGGKTLLQLLFEASRIEGGADSAAVTPQNILVVDTTVLIDRDQTRILTGKTTGTPFYLAVSVKEVAP